MFEAAELGRKVSKEEFDERLPDLRAQLVEAQLAARKARLPVVILLAGVDGAGKGEAVERITEWLDPRGVDTFAFGEPSQEERERPLYWRFWRTLPARGRIGIYYGAWYSRPLTRRLAGEIKDPAFDRELARIVALEQMLAADGALMLKFWYHLSQKAQRRRLRKLAEDPLTEWRVLPTDWQQQTHYRKFIRIAERAVRQTDVAPAGWHLIEAANARYRDLTTGTLLLDALRQRIVLANRPKAPAAASAKALMPAAKSGTTILSHVDLTQTLTPRKYRARCAKCQGKLNRLAWEAKEKGVATVAVFEGWDAGGKGGAIRRIVEAVDARLYRIIPIAAPTDEELAQHYLWRFWRHLPRAGMLTIFDRSWYGRVLVERVEGFARPEEWSRAYAEINEFESQLVEHGIVLAKFWLHISRDEQLRRFKEREQLAYKKHKITAEDWRNRKRWPAYEAAVNDMVAHTSTEYAPWTLVPGNCKRFARVDILKTLCRRIGQAL